MAYFCDRTPVSWFKYEIVDCNKVCQACACINPCAPCKRVWVHWKSLGSVECPVPCESYWLDTKYEYYCNDATCGQDSRTPCCWCEEDPVVKPGAPQQFTICPPAEDDLVGARTVMRRKRC